MSKPKLTNSCSKQLLNVSITSPKGSLIAQINNLRKQLKDYKQLKKQGSQFNSQKPTKDNNHNIFISNSVMKSPQHLQKSFTQQQMNKTAKEKFFKSSSSNNIKDDLTLTNNNNNNLTNNLSRKLFHQIQKQKQQLSPKDNNKNHQKRQKSHNKNTHSRQKQSINLLQQSQQFKDNNTTQQQIKLSQIIIKEKDRKLKLDIQLNKLRKVIIKLGPYQISQQINYIIQLINGTLKQYIIKIDRLEKNQRIDQSDQGLLIKRQQGEIQQLMKRVEQGEEEIKKLQKQLKQKKQFDQQTNQMRTKQTEQLTIYRTKIEQLQQQLKQFQQKSIQLQQQNRILSIKLLKKQQQLLLIDEDINYLRLQTENSKQQKKQFNQLYESTINEYRQYKRTKSIEIEKLQSQKQKWQKQCKLRRSENEAIKQLEEQKLTVLKQLGEMRLLVNLKSTQLQQKKSTMYENQKRVIMLQSQVYKLKSELQTVKNQKEFAQFENEKLREQLQDVRKYGGKNVRRGSVNGLGLVNDLNNSNNNNKGSKSKQKVLVIQPSSSSTTNHYATTTIISNNTINKNNTSQQSNYIDNNIIINTQTNKQFSPQQLQYYQTLNIIDFDQRKQHYNKKLKDKQDKLKALDDIHSLIKKHRQDMQI